MQKFRGFLRCLGLSAAALVFAVLLLAAAALLPQRTWVLRTAAFLYDPRFVFSQEEAQNAVQSSQNPSIAARGPQPSPSPLLTPTPQPTAVPTPTPAPTATPQPTPVPTVPEDALPVVAQNYTQGSGDGYVELPAGSIKNMTDHTDAELGAAARAGGGELPFAIQCNSDQPQVLILHTHATECYQPWDEPYYDPAFTARTLDTTQNMCAVGARMAEVLNAAGINTLHDQTLHDSPSYTESYARSAATTKSYLEKYPSIKVVLDVHRDAIENASAARVKPLCEINGENAAQVMIIAGCNNGSSVRLPNWRLNLQFAAAWEQRMEELTPGLTRPVLCGYRFYNQDLTTGSLLIEIGGHGNTLEEAIRGGEAAAAALADLFGA